MKSQQRNCLLGICILTALVARTSPSMAQTSGGYYISRTEILPDLFIKTDPFALPITVNHEDVKAIGMGKSQMANGSGFNAMLYNPALLARVGDEFSVSSQFGLPPDSYKAIGFLSDHIGEFRDGTFLKLIKQGVHDFKAAATVDEQLSALRTIQNGLRFVNDLQDAMGGTADDPKTHGLSVIPALQAKIGNFGISLSGTAQSGFELYPGAAIPQLLALKIPDNVQEIDPATLVQLIATVDPLIDANGQMRDDALPEAYAISYIDIVGAVGYAVHLDPALSVGANIKVANRRFSTKRIAPDQFDSIIRELRRDFTTSVTGVSLDLGALYEFSHTGTDVGLSVQNIVPLQVVSSSVRADFLVSGIQDYDRDGNGDPIVTNRDTALVAAQQNARIEIPFELKTPLLVNVGTRQVINDRWDASLDVVDLAGQDIKFENALERVRLGTEYRLGTRDQFEVAVRAGLADLRPTFGIGLNIFRVLQLDAAYAFDNFLDENAIFAQARVGW